MRRLLLYGCLLIFCFGCSKENSTKKILVQGRLLQSSSNPVPVANYKLSFYQAGNSTAPFPIDASPSSLDFTTNSEGYFNCNFPLGNGTFIVFPTSNTNVLSISGAKNNGIQLGWYGLPARDTDLVNTYLYKKVHEAIIQINPATNVTNNDTLFISTSTLTGSYEKMITGLSIAQNSIATIDTVTDVIFTNYSFQERMYQNNILIKRNQNFYSAFGAFELEGDEDEKSYLFKLQ